MSRARAMAVAGATGVRFERLLDAGHADCSLRDTRVASLLERALHYFDGVRYGLLAWVVMPNHVHVLIETRRGFPVPGVVHSWKSFSAKEANHILSRQGQFWQPDYFHRLIRMETPRSCSSLMPAPGFRP